ncbi:hypothetical protein [Corallococcus macrosporus]|uniref:DUF4350 domain-containing protein n=1 Tax=Corallococcus macrosporus DSM 14697 TaxID=1189310 RepID=A0A250K383_9BACT|nr:hypothetical protein [Corallococcus macrosporus]ATB50525.1 hypothetical protein MYMAC_006181 [Corallococcus macrosporus DSM 14697]
MRRVWTVVLALLVLGAARASATSLVTEQPPSGHGYRDASGTYEVRTQGDLRVSLRSGALRPSRGYTPLDVVLQNTGPVPLQVRLAFVGQGTSGTRTSERSVEVAPRQRLVAWVHVPASLQMGNLRVEVPGQVPLTKHVYLESSSGGSVLVLGALEDFDDTAGVPRVDSNGSPLFSARAIEPKDAPRELPAYVGYSVVVVPGDRASLPADVWTVLEAYALSGGRLVVTHASGDVLERLPLLARNASEPSAPYGFGVVRLCGSARECEQVVNGLLGDVIPGVVKPAGAAPRWERGNALAGGIPPLLGNAMAPVGRFLLLIFVFVLAVGPGGLMLARRRGPVAVLVAVPMVSVITCLALIAWSVLVDGFAVHAARYSLTWLDSERSRAVTLGVSAWYANVSSGPVRFPVTSALLAPDSHDDALADLDWTGGLTVTHGFLPPRTYREWGEVAVLPSRARLVMRKEGDAVRVLNALGAPMEGGVLQLGHRRYALPALADGAEGPLGEHLREVETPLHQVLTSAERPRLAHGRFEAGEVNFRAALPDGGFVVRLGGLGLAPSSAVDVELEAGIHLVRGQAEEVRP